MYSPREPLMWMRVGVGLPVEASTTCTCIHCRSRPSVWSCTRPEESWPRWKVSPREKVRSRRSPANLTESVASSAPNASIRPSAPRSGSGAWARPASGPFSHRLPRGPSVFSMRTTPPRSTPADSISGVRPVTATR